MDKGLERWINREIPNESMKICDSILSEDEQDKIVDRVLKDLQAIQKEEEDK